MGDGGGAVGALDRAIALNDNNVGALAAAGAVFVSRRDGASAIPLLRRAVDLAPRHVDAWSSLGTATTLANMVGEAFSAFQTAISCAPDKNRLVALWHGVGVMYDVHGSAELAVDAFNTVLSLQPTYECMAEVQFALGRLHLHFGRSSDALTAFLAAAVAPAALGGRGVDRGIRPLAPADPWVQAAKVYEALGDLAGLIRAVRALVALEPPDQPSPAMLQRLGWLLYSSTPSAVAAAESADIMGVSTEVWGWNSHAVDSAGGNGGGSDTGAAADDGAAGGSRNPRTVTRPPMHKDVEDRTLGEAASLLEGASELAPTDASSCLMLGHVALSMNDGARAFSAFSAASDRAPRSPAPWCCIGLLYLRASQSSDAMDAFARAIERDASSADTWCYLGALYASCEQPRDSVDSYRKAAQLAPPSMALQRRLAVAEEVLEASMVAAAAAEGSGDASGADGAAAPPTSGGADGDHRLTPQGPSSQAHSQGHSPAHSQEHSHTQSQAPSAGRPAPVYAPHSVPRDAALRHQGLPQQQQPQLQLSQPPPQSWLQVGGARKRALPPDDAPREQDARAPMEVSYDRAPRPAAAAAEAPLSGGGPTTTAVHGRDEGRGRAGSAAGAPNEAGAEPPPVGRLRQHGPFPEARTAGGRGDVAKPLRRDASQPRLLKQVKPQHQTLFPPAQQDAAPTHSASSSAPRDAKRQRMAGDGGGGGGGGGEAAIARALAPSRDVLSPASSAKKDEAAFRRAASHDLLSFATSGRVSASAARRTPTPPPPGRGPSSRYVPPQASGSAGAGGKGIPPLGESLAGPRRLVNLPLPPASAGGRLPTLASTARPDTAVDAAAGAGGRRSPDGPPREGGGTPPRASPSARRLPRVRSSEALRGDPSSLRGSTAGGAGDGLPPSGVAADRRGARDGSGDGVATRPGSRGGGRGAAAPSSRDDPQADCAGGGRVAVGQPIDGKASTPWPAAGQFAPPPPRLRGSALSPRKALPPGPRKSFLESSGDGSGGGSIAADGPLTVAERPKGGRLSRPTVAVNTDGAAEREPRVGHRDGSSRPGRGRPADAEGGGADVAGLRDREMEREPRYRRGGARSPVDHTNDMEASPHGGASGRDGARGSDGRVERGTKSSRRRHSGGGSSGSEASGGGGSHDAQAGGSASTLPSRPVSTLARFGRRTATPTTASGGAAEAEDGSNHRFGREPSASGDSGGEGDSGSGGSGGWAGGRARGSSAATSPPRDADDDDSDYDGDRERQQAGDVSDGDSGGEASTDAPVRGHRSDRSSGERSPAGRGEPPAAASPLPPRRRGGDSGSGDDRGGSRGGSAAGSMGGRRDATGAASGGGSSSEEDGADRSGAAPSPPSVAWADAGSRYSSGRSRPAAALAPRSPHADGGRRGGGGVAAAADGHPSGGSPTARPRRGRGSPNGGSARGGAAWHGPENGGDAPSGGRGGGRPSSGSGGSRDGAGRGVSRKGHRKATGGSSEEDARRGKRESSSSPART